MLQGVFSGHPFISPSHVLNAGDSGGDVFLQTL